MKKKTLISIIITYYKKKIFLKKTIQSILKQSYKNYELIFVYDDKDKKDIRFINNTRLLSYNPVFRMGLL